MISGPKNYLTIEFRAGNRGLAVYSIYCLLLLDVGQKINNYSVRSVLHGGCLGPEGSQRTKAFSIFRAFLKNIGQGTKPLLHNDRAIFLECTVAIGPNALLLAGTGKNTCKPEQIKQVEFDRRQ